MSDLGSDFAAPGGDLTTDMRSYDTDAQKLVGFLESLAERLQTPRGALFYDLAYGLDMRSYLSDDEEPAIAGHEIEQQCLQDERCATCNVSIVVAAGGDWQISIAGSTDTGAVYDFTFLVNSSKVTILTSLPSAP